MKLGSPMSSYNRLTAVALLIAVIPASPAGAGDLETVGDVLQFAIPAGAVAVSAYKGDVDGLWQFGATYAVTGAFTHGLKYAIDETAWGERPNGGGHSFPSGHTSSAFSGAAYLHFRYGWEYGLPAAALSTIVAYSRVESDKHYVRDVIGGALLSYGAAFALTDQQSDSVSIVPYIEIQKPNFGVVARLRF